MAKDDKSTWVFEGFSSPQFTQTPNIFFDSLMPDLKEAELKVLLYIIRRTWGFAGKQDGDAISISQLCNGITTRDGRQIDRGTGLSKGGVTKALYSLRTKGIITRIRNRSEIRGDTASTYRLRMVGEPVDDREEPPELPLSPLRDTPVPTGGHPLSTQEDTLVPTEGHPVSPLVDTQYKEIKERDERKTDRNLEDSKNQPINFDSAKIREELIGYVEDFAREFNDEAPLRSSVTRMVNIYYKSGVDLEVFVDAMYTARTQVKEWSASIKKEASGKSAFTRKNRMPYFFATLENLVGIASGQRQSS